MRAIILKEQGGPENLSITELPTPEPGPADVLVEVHAISINPVDIKTRKGGALYATLKKDEYAILGWDVSGVVKAVGAEVKQFKEGDAVFGMVNFPGHGKAYAEYVVAPAAHLALKPDNCTHAEAAAATLAALTAWQVLVHQAGIQPGQHLLMHAAAGGVGHYAVQIAKHLGATVTGTASAANAGFLQELGVDHVIDYTTVNFEEQVSDVDMVFDPIGGETTRRSIQVLRPGGTLVSIVGGVKDNLSPLFQQKSIKAKNYLVQSSGSDMQQLAELIQQGILRSTISHQFSFDEMDKAHQQIETGKTRGKVVVNVRG
ncbi:MAG TPA: NADP-dependent oxidoreductase [Chitinophagaceae bacterium]|nr:NADP-dependent oxidoreductase [Chitinophagaceae bacterium]